MRDVLAVVLGARPAQILSEAAWDEAVPMLRNQGLLGRLAYIVEESNAGAALPARAREHLQAARVVAENHRRVMDWEVDRIARALAGTGARVVLLKGAAYAAAGLPSARGRLASDVDLLVAEELLPAVEAALLSAGWEAVKTDPYDQRYYREWMHELPPLRHALRGTFVDVHRSILPLSARLHPDPSKLLAAARPVAGQPFHVLAPHDLVLHCATHLFYDGDFDSGLRDLVDFHDLLAHFGGDAGFWRALVPRARELDLLRPLFYALHFAPRLIETAVPAAVAQAARAGAPSRPVLAVMERLVAPAILPRELRPGGRVPGIGQWLLYLRSHYLRMPLHLLVPHLLRKARVRAAQE